MDAEAHNPAATSGVFREYAVLEKLRSSVGVTPLEYQRWFELRKQLEAEAAVNGGEAREFERTPTRMKIEFKTGELLLAAVIQDLSKGGVFVSTPFAAEVGTELVLLLSVRSTGDTVELPGVVVTNNLSDGFSTSLLGMGVRFEQLSAAQQTWVDELYASAKQAAKASAR